MSYTILESGPVHIAPQSNPCDFSAGDPIALRTQAMRCRRLADSIDDRRTLEILSAMAADYETRARELETRES